MCSSSRGETPRRDRWGPPLRRFAVDPPRAPSARALFPSLEYIERRPENAVPHLGLLQDGVDGRAEGRVPHEEAPDELQQLRRALRERRHPALSLRRRNRADGGTAARRGGPDDEPDQLLGIPVPRLSSDPDPFPRRIPHPLWKGSWEKHIR